MTGDPASAGRICLDPANPVGLKADPHGPSWFGLRSDAFAFDAATPVGPKAAPRNTARAALTFLPPAATIATTPRARRHGGNRRSRP